MLYHCECARVLCVCVRSCEIAVHLGMAADGTLHVYYDACMRVHARAMHCGAAAAH
jgi:hypothetical protein